jgi:hypothetical protein
MRGGTRRRSGSLAEKPSGYGSRAAFCHHLRCFPRFYFLRLTSNLVRFAAAIVVAAVAAVEYAMKVQTNRTAIVLFSGAVPMPTPPSTRYDHQSIEWPSTVAPIDHQTAPSEVAGAAPAFQACLPHKR